MLIDRIWYYIKTDAQTRATDRLRYQELKLQEQVLAKEACDAYAEMRKGACVVVTFHEGENWADDYPCFAYYNTHICPHFSENKICNVTGCNSYSAKHKYDIAYAKWYEAHRCIKNFWRDAHIAHNTNGK